MDKPLQIELPVELRPGATLNNEHHSDCPYHLSFADRNQLQCDIGELYSQAVNGKHYWIELLYFNINKRCEIGLRADKAFVPIEYSIKGNAQCELQGKGEVELRAGFYCGFYVTAGLHKVYLIPGEYLFLYLVPSREQLLAMQKEHAHLALLASRLEAGSEEGEMLPYCKMTDKVIKILQRMMRCEKKRTRLHLALQGYILDLLGVYDGQLTRKRNDDMELRKETVMQVEEYIQQSYMNRDMGNAEDIARKFYVTRKTLDKDFVQEFGGTVHAYVLQLRMNKAYNLLTSMTVHETAEAVGYEDVYHFSRAFKKKFGISPSERKGR